MLTFTRALVVLGLLLGGSVGSAEKLATHLATQLQTMQRVQEQVCANTGMCDSEPLGSAIQTMQQLQQRLRIVAGDPEEAGPPVDPGNGSGAIGPNMEPGGPNGPADDSGVGELNRCGTACAGEDDCEPCTSNGPGEAQGPSGPSDGCGDVCPVGDGPYGDNGVEEPHRCGTACEGEVDCRPCEPPDANGPSGPNGPSDGCLNGCGDTQGPPEDAGSPAEPAPPDNSGQLQDPEPSGPANGQPESGGGHGNRP